MVATAEKAMVKRNDVSVKIDAEVVELCRVAASFKRVSLAEYLSEALRPIARADIDEGYAQLAPGEGGPKKKGPK